MSNILCPLAEAARKCADEPALITSKQIITYGDYERLVAAAAFNLQICGVTTNERVAIISANCLEYPILLMALFRLKAVACLISPRFPEQTIADYLARIRCDLVIDLTNTLQNKVRWSTNKLAITDLVGPADVCMSPTNDPFISLQQDGTIIHTSGTTAQPKAVLHSYGSHYYNALGSNRNIKVEPGDQWLLSLPLYHVGGLAILFRAMLGSGAVVIPKDNADILDAMQRHQVTHLSLVTTQLYRLLKVPSLIHYGRQLRAVLVGGSAISKSLIAKAHECGLPLFTTYGLTEMASQVTTTRPADPLGRLLTSGTPLEYRQIRIDNDGEISVKGETLFGGYVDKTTVKLPVDNDGWFHTGDLGSIDASGYLTVVGRKDNMFISGGENIYPEEIEGALSLLDRVSEAVVVPIEDDEYGFRPVAIVRMANNQASKNELVDCLKKHLPHFKVPIRFYLWPESTEKQQMKPRRHYFQQLIKYSQLTELS